MFNHLRIWELGETKSERSRLLIIALGKANQNTHDHVVQSHRDGAAGVSTVNDEGQIGECRSKPTSSDSGAGVS